MTGSTALGEVCGITSSLVDPREQPYADMAHVGGANMTSGTGALIDLQTAREQGLRSGKFVFDETMVLYSKIRPYLNKVACPDFSGLCSADVYPLSPDVERLDRGYLFYVLLSPEFIDYAVSNSARAGMPKVNREALFAYRFTLPALSEQRKIVALLDDAFMDIGAAKLCVERSLEHSRSLLQSELQAVFDSFEENGWERRTVGECCSIHSGGTPSRSNASYWQGRIPWVSAKDLKSDCISDALLHISEDAVRRSATKIAPAGSILILVRGMGLANGIPLAEVLAPVAFNQDIKSIHPPADVLPRYLLMSLKSHMIRTGGNGLLGAAAHGTLKLDTDGLRRIPFAVPPLERQASLVSDLDALADAARNLEGIYQRKLLALEELRQSLLCQALDPDLALAAT